MGDATINVQLSDDGALSTVIAGGSVTIENSADFRQALAEAFNQATMVALDIRRLEEIDITAAQVICSACKTAAASERCLVADGDLPECIIDLGKNIGAPQGMPCIQNRNEPCNWFGGAK